MRSPGFVSPPASGKAVAGPLIGDVVPPDDDAPDQPRRPRLRPRRGDDVAGGPLSPPRTRPSSRRPRAPTPLRIAERRVVLLGMLPDAERFRLLHGPYAPPPCRETETKAEHHEGGADRWVPIFPELRPYLEEAFEQAEPGTVHLVNRYRDPNAN